MKMIQLSRKSWLRVVHWAIPCTEQEFQDMWKECPTTRQKMQMYGKTVEMARGQRLYGDASYGFSGIRLEPEPNIPPLIQKCIDYARENYTNHSWNGALVNFYPDGESYISQHSDDEKDLATGAPILSFSFGGERTFVVQSKTKGGKCDLFHTAKGNTAWADEEDNTTSSAPHYAKEIKIPTLHGSMIEMCGEMQSEFTHGVPKALKSDGQIKPRINVTVRSFNAPAKKRKKQETEE